jgi:hypothetical protein
MEKIKELKKELSKELSEFEGIQKDAKEILNSNSYIREEFKYLNRPS